MIQIEMIETSSLGDRSYLATDGEVAVAVDPQRDVDRLLNMVEHRGVRLTHVVETHVHTCTTTTSPEGSSCPSARGRPACSRPAAT